MRILLDECLPVDFRHSLPGHDVHTVEWAGLKGTKNGELLDAAETAGYDVFLTVDRGIARRQRSVGCKLSIVVVQAPTNQIEDLMPVAPVILQIITSARPGEILLVSRTGLQ